jgi:serine/threonine protein kinase
VQVRLLDFGIAKLLDGYLGTQATKTGFLMGTPHYLSPEQVTEAKAVDARADLYSVGVIVYEWLAGYLPYDAQTFVELIVKMQSELPRPLPVEGSPLKRRLGEIALTCLARDPAARPASCSLSARALGRPSKPRR